MGVDGLGNTVTGASLGKDTRGANAGIELLELTSAGQALRQA